MVIAFFGASVTQQKNGYVSHFLKNIKETVMTYGYGSMHLKYAGVCMINNVLECKPNIVFIDWFSTGYINTNDETINCLDTIVSVFSKNNIKLIFLFFPRKDHNERINFYLFCKKYLNDKKLFYIDLNEYLNYNEELIRDTVHTTEKGSKIYGELIYDIYIKNIKEINICKNYLHVVKYENIKKIIINKNFSNFCELNGNCNVLGLYMIIGVHSGILEINGVKFNTWDEWCHYNRHCLKLEFNVNGKTKINIINEVFDTSKCKNKEIKFENIKKELQLKEIYYIGNNLEFISGK